MSPSKKTWFRALVAHSAIAAASSFTGGRCASFLVPSSSGGRTCKASNSIAGQTAPSSSLPAIIFGWDGDEYDEYTPIDDNDGSFGPSPSSSVATAVAECISQNQEKLGTLARLAVAFSPPDRALDIATLDHVSILAIDEDHIEIEAVVCDDQSCSSLFVPVSFPRGCEDWVGEEDALRGCVLDNLDELDVEAENRLREMEAKTVDADGDDLEELCTLYAKADYPGWWVPPECSDALVAECDTISRLLNDEDFQGDVNALARRGLEDIDFGNSYEVKRAVVSAVGPAGLCIKAKAALRSQYTGNHEPARFLDVPLPFEGEPRLDPASLRAAVLGAVAAAHVD